MMELTRREFIKSSIYFPSAVKAWMREQIDGEPESDEQIIYQAFLPFVAAGAKELTGMKVQWTWGDFGAGPDEGTDVLHDSDTRVKLRECDIWITRLKGHGMPPVKPVLEPKGDNQAGITWVKDNLESRELEMMLNISGTEDQMWAARRLLVKKFTPRNSLEFDGILKFTVPGGYVRWLYVRYKNGLEFDDVVPSDIGSEMHFPLLVWAEDPLFYNEAISSEIDIMAAPPPFNQSFTVTNNGDWDVFPSITLSAAGGTVIDPLLENTTTGEAVQLVHTLTDTQQISYVLTFGNKDIVKTGVGSILDDMTPGSSLGSFHLQPGDNIIKVTIDAASTGVSRTTVSFRAPYLSL